MKVKISYSLDLGEVPSKALKMMEPNEAIINDIVNKCNLVKALLREDLGTSGSIAVAVINLDKVRYRLAEMDEGLKEISAILGGYHRAISSQNEAHASPVFETPFPTAEETNEPETEEPDEPEVSEFISKLMEQSDADEG